MGLRICAVHIIELNLQMQQTLHCHVAFYSSSSCVKQCKKLQKVVTKTANGTKFGGVRG